MQPCDECRACSLPDKAAQAKATLPARWVAELTEEEAPDQIWVSALNIHSAIVEKGDDVPASFLQSVADGKINDDDYWEIPILGGKVTCRHGESPVSLRHYSVFRARLMARQRSLTPRTVVRVHGPEPSSQTHGSVAEHGTGFNARYQFLLICVKSVLTPPFHHARLAQRPGGGPQNRRDRFNSGTVLHFHTDL